MERNYIVFYLDLIMNFLEFFAYIKYCNYYLQSKNKKYLYLRNYTLYTIYTIIVSALSIPFFWLLTLIVAYIFNLFTYEVTHKINLYHVIRFNILYYVPYSILVTIGIFIFDLNIPNNNDFYHGLKGIVVASILLIIFSFVFNNKKYESRPIINPYRKFVYPLLSLILFILCTLVFISFNLDAKKETFQNIIIITFIVNIIILVLIISIYEKIVTFLQDAALKQLKIQQYEMNQGFYDELSTKTKQLSGLKHDFKNHLTIINGWLQQEKYSELDSYLNSLQNYVITSSDVIITNNQTISSIMQAKKSRCEKQEIQLICDIDFEEIYKISDMDLIILLGNILDNAIDAVERIQDGKRQIKLTIKQLKSYLSITCLNPIAIIPIEKDGILLTTKVNKGIHGIGLSNVIDTCKKYNGECSYSYNEKEFQIELLLPNY